MDDPGAIYDEAAFSDAHEKDYYEVPLILGTDESLKGYGRIVHDFDAEEVWIEQWPQTGKRPVCPGTGKGARLSSVTFASIGTEISYGQTTWRSGKLVWTS